MEETERHMGMVEMTSADNIGRTYGTGSGSKPESPVKYWEIRKQYLAKTTRTRCLFLTPKQLH